MLKDLIRFEWRYHTRQVSFAAALLLFAGFGFALTATGFGPDNVNVNSPYAIAQSLGLLSLAGVFIVAVFCASAVIRDRDHRMEEIVFTTPVSKLDYLGGRFAGSFLAAMTAFGGSLAGMMLALAMPWQEPSRIGPFSLSAYLWPLLVMALPGLLVSAVVLFGVAGLTRSMAATIVGAVGIYFFYFAAAALTNSPLMAGSKPGAVSPAAASLLDPFGLAAFFEQTRYWTPALRNTRLAALTGNLLLSRVVWLGVAGALWIFSWRRMSFGLLSGSRGAAAQNEAATAIEPVVDQRPTVPTSDSGWRALLSQTKIELHSSMAGVPFILLTLLWCALAAVEIVNDVTGGEYGSALYPATGLALTTLRQPLSLIATIVLIYFSGEMVWRERTAGIADILHATPAPSSVFVISKWIALSAMSAVLVLSGSIVALIVQLARGYPHFEPLVMLGFAWFSLVPLVVLAMVAVLIQTLSRHKYAGLLAVFALAVVVNAGGAIGLEHPLLRFGGLPDVDYSAMTGFIGAAQVNWLMALWGAVGALCLLLAAALWRRAVGDRARSIVSTILRTTTPVAIWLGVGLASIAVVIAGIVFYDTNVAHVWMSSRAALDWRADYERRYRPAAVLPQPRLTAITANVTLEPRQGRHAAAGTLSLVNDTLSPISTILLSVRHDTKVARLALDVPATVSIDRRFSTWTFRLNEPLQRGRRLSVRFGVSRTASRFGPDERSVVGNGSLLFDERIFPVIGYRRSREISDSTERRKRGLPPLDKNSAAGEDLGNHAPWIDFDLTVSTDADQIALAPGRLASQWTRDGRRFFRYLSGTPTHGTLMFASARYAVATARAGHVSISAFFHPDHRQNVGRILAAAADSVRLFEQAYGRYPHDELRIAEVPAFWPFGGLAMPGLIFLNENRAMLIDGRDPRRLDLVTRRTAHEVAHQWWGHLVTPAEGPGSSMLVESLTKYCELRVLQSRYGREPVRRSLELELDRYLAGRTSARRAEVPLARATDEPWLYYGKGAIVLCALEDLLGSAVLNGALQRFFALASGPHGSADTATLVAELRAVASPAQQALVGQWMDEVVLYDLGVDAAEAHRRADGRFDVLLHVHSGKSRVDAAGRQTPLPFDEDIAVALIAARGEAPRISRHRLHGGRETISVVTDAAPWQAEIDPEFLRIDADRSNNSTPVVIRP